MKKKLAAGAGAVGALAAVVTLYLVEPTPVVAPHVYLAVTGTPPTRELWLEREAPLPPLKLNGPLQTTVERGHVNSFALSGDGQRVAYTANAEAAHPLDYNLYGVTIGGPPVWKVSQYPLIFDYDVHAIIQFDEPGNRVIYRVGVSSYGNWTLWSALWIGGGRKELSWPSMPMGTMVRSDFSILSGNWVRFASDYEQDETFRWYVVRPDGGRISRELFCDGFEGGNDGAWT